MTIINKSNRFNFLLLTAILLLFLHGCSGQDAEVKTQTAEPVKELTWEEKFAQKKKDAEEGNAEAQNDLGWMYNMGNGVPKDVTKALEWW